MLKVEGKEGLVKDPHSNTVLNTNREEYERYKSARKRNLELAETVKKQDEEIRTLNERFERLEKVVSRLSNTSAINESRFRTY